MPVCMLGIQAAIVLQKVIIGAMRETVGAGAHTFMQWKKPEEEEIRKKKFSDAKALAVLLHSSHSTSFCGSLFIVSILHPRDFLVRLLLCSMILPKENLP